MMYFIPLISKEIGAGLMVGLFTAIIIWLIEMITSRKNRTVEKKKTNTDSTIRDLESLKNKGLLSEDEYQSKVKAAKNSELDHIVKRTSDYKKLATLLKKGILTENEFKSKINILKRNIEKKSYDADSFAIRREHYNEVRKQKIISGGFLPFIGPYEKFEVILDDGSRARYYKQINGELHFVYVKDVKKEFPNRNMCFSFIATHYVD